MNFRKKMIAVVLVGVGFGFVQSGAAIKFPNGWEVENGKVTSYPFAPGKTKDSYEVKRDAGVQPQVLLVAGALGVEGTLNVWMPKGLSINDFSDQNGEFVQWISPDNKPQTFGPVFNKHAIGILAVRPSEYEKEGRAKEVEAFTKEEVRTKLTDQRFSAAQLDTIAARYAELKKLYPTLSMVADYYTARQFQGTIQGGVKPGDYAFARFDNLGELINKCSAQPLTLDVVQGWIS